MQLSNLLRRISKEIYKVIVLENKGLFGRSKIELSISLIVYFIGILYGFVYMPTFAQQTPQNLVLNSNKNSFTFDAVLLNNIILWFFSSIVGLITGGAIGLTIVFLSGMTVGAMLCFSVKINKLQAVLFLLLFPHGIIESFALIIASSAGLNLLKNMLKHSTKFIDDTYLVQVCDSFLLFLISAFLETYVGVLMINLV